MCMCVPECMYIYHRVQKRASEFELQALNLFFGPVSIILPDTMIGIYR